MASLNQDQTLKGTFSPIAADLALSRERIFNHIPITVIGYNPSVPLATPEALQPQGGDVIFPTVAQILNIVSSSANDTSAGTGARTVTLAGLDENWDPIVETVTLNGLTPVPTVNAFLRINNFYVTTAGSLMANDGNLTVTASIDATTVHYMLAGDSTHNSIVFSVPRSMDITVYTFDWAVGRKNQAAVDLTFVVQDNNGPSPVRSRFKFTSTNSQGTSYSSSAFKIPLRFLAKQDLWLEANSGTEDIEAVAYYTAVLVDTDNRKLSASQIVG